MQGKIIKGIAGFYYVHVPKEGIFTCKAKGAFRNNKEKPLVGDNVIIVPENDEVGNITQICSRKNEMIRPAVANVDQALVVFAALDPEPNLNLLDRFLVMMEHLDIPCAVCFNKADLAQEELLTKLSETYTNAHYPVFVISALNLTGMDEVRQYLKGKTTVLAGPSGVGKSSFVNFIYPQAEMETGSISEKIRRGKHTTRHSELFTIDSDTYLFDTPGFSSLAVPDIEKEELRFYFPEFTDYEGECRFNGCIHQNEPSCKVKEALTSNAIGESRYQNYLQMLNELSERKRY